jgi:hypothetical protein
VLLDHLAHDFADRTGRADYRNAWQHDISPFPNGGNHGSTDVSVLAARTDAGKRNR